MKRINELLEDVKSEILEVEKLIFLDVGDRDVYNVSKSFRINSEEYLFGRVEPRDNSELSRVFLFRKTSGGWVPDGNFVPLENSEDPFVFEINGEFILGCVEVVKMTAGHEFDPENKLNYRTVLHGGKNPWELRKVFEGPWKMKDIRFAELPDKKIAVFSRLQGGKAGRGKMGFLIVNSFEDLDSEKLENAPLLNCFWDGEWGGANHVHLLENGKLFVLGHIAKRNEDNSVSYYPMYFIFNPETKEYSEMKILFERKHLPEGESKNERLKDVIFPGGFNKNDDGTLDIYVGVGDAEGYMVRVKKIFES